MNILDTPLMAASKEGARSDSLTIRYSGQQFPTVHRPFAMLALSLLPAACDAPGEGQTAESGYRYCEQINADLEAYKERTHAYPDSLEQLATNSIAHQASPQGIDGILYYVDSNHSAYELTFNYAGPGMNKCTFSSGRKDWDCHGYY